MGNFIEFISKNELQPLIEPKVINPILRDLFVGENYVPGEIIAKGLSLMGFDELLVQLTSKQFNEKNISQADVSQAILGFTSYIHTIHAGYLATSVGIDRYRDWLIKSQSSTPLNENYLLVANRMLANDPWGIEFADMVAFVELGKSSNYYFKVGIEYGRQSFFLYTKVMKTIGVYEISKLDCHLDVNKMHALVRNKELMVNPTHRNLIMDRTNYQWNVSEKRRMQITINFDRLLRVMIDLHEEKISDKAKIYEVSKYWEEILSLSLLDQYHALFSSIHLCAGKFMESAYEMTLDKTFLIKAMDLYITPLKKYSFWLNDPGTRYGCALRIINLLLNHSRILRSSMTASELGNLFHDVIIDAIKTNERLFLNSTYDFSKSIIQGRVDEIVGLFAELVSSSGLQNQLNTYEFNKLLQTIEKNKSKLLNLEISMLEVKSPPECPKELYAKEQEYLNVLRNIRAKQHGKFVDADDYSAEIDNLEQYNVKRVEIEEVWSKMQKISSPLKQYVSFRRSGCSLSIDGEDYEYRAFQKIGKNTALISFFLAQEYIYTLLTIPDLNLHVTGAKHIEKKEFTGYLLSYEHEIQKRNDLSGDHYWQRLGDIIFSDIGNYLSRVNRICVIPHKDLHHFPIQALFLKGKPMIEEWEFFHAPSLRVLETTTAKDANYSKNLVMGYVPPGSSKGFSQAILDEINDISSILKTQPLSEDSSTSSALQNASGAEIIHIAGHGKYVEDSPIDSGVVLSDGVFSARDWLNVSINADLVTMSACQTGLSEIRPGDELVGLARAVLFSGASTLLTSLWSVSGNSTRDLMRSFYSKRYGSNGVKVTDKATALRDAILEVKKEYKDPYYWAPFILSGNPA